MVFREPRYLSFSSIFLLTPAIDLFILFRVYSLCGFCVCVCVRACVCLLVCLDPVILDLGHSVYVLYLILVYPLESLRYRSHRLLPYHHP